MFSYCANIIYFCRWVITSDEDSTVFVFSWEACLDPGLPQIIGVRSEERKDIGVRCLNTYSGEIVSVQVRHFVWSCRTHLCNLGRRCWACNSCKYWRYQWYYWGQDCYSGGIKKMTFHLIFYFRTFGKHQKKTFSMKDNGKLCNLHLSTYLHTYKHLFNGIYT